MMQTRSLLDMQEFIRRLIVQIIFQVLLYHFISVPLKSGQININQTIPEKGKN